MFWLYLLYYVLLMVVFVAGLAISAIGLPGLWLMVVAAAVYALATGGAVLSWPGVATLAALAAAAEVAEFLAGAAGSTTAGGSGRALIGAIVGGIVGGLVGVPVPLFGPVVGAILGAAIGAAALELTLKRDLWNAGNIAWGAAKGRFWGTLSKVAFGSVMLCVAAVVAFPKPSDLPPRDVPGPVDASQPDAPAKLGVEERDFTRRLATGRGSWEA